MNMTIYIRYYTLLKYNYIIIEGESGHISYVFLKDLCTEILGVFLIKPAGMQ